MKQALIAAVVCLLLSIVPIEVKDGTLTIFYALVGVIFSVGMSLIISFHGSAIENAELRTEIRTNVHDIRNNFLTVFLISSALYCAYSLLSDDLQIIKINPYEGISIQFTWSLSVLLFHIYSMIALISNYIDIQKLYENIEDRIIRERQDKAKQATRCPYLEERANQH